VGVGGVRRGCVGRGLEAVRQAVAELRDGVAQGDDARRDGRAGEVERIAGRVEMALKDCGFFSSEIE
jgi:hypothetical protein